MFGLFSEVTIVGKVHNTMWFMEMNDGLKALCEGQKVRFLKIVKKTANFLFEVQWLRCAIKRKCTVR